MLSLQAARQIHELVQSGELRRGERLPSEREAAKGSPIPFAPILEKEILPDDQDVLDALHRVMDYAG